MKFKQILGAIAVLVSLSSQAIATVAVSNAVPTGSSYTISLPQYAVTDIAIVNLGQPFTTITIGPSGTPFMAATPGPTTISQTYLTAAQFGTPGFVYTPGSTFLLGVTSNLPDDAPDQEHLVLFTNNAFATSAQNIAFGTLFPNTNETTLIDDLVTRSIGSNEFNFAGGDAISGPDGSIAFTPGSDFTAIAFSGGQIIGTGTSMFTTGVPEPATVTLLLAAVGGIGMARRARTRNATA